jgi:hypothetical protein
MKSEFLEEDIQAYFTGGACSAFALVLQNNFPEYKLGILYDKAYDYPEHGGLAIFHVFCHTTDNTKSIDVYGVRNIPAMISSFSPELPEIKFNIPKKEILSKMGEGKPLAEIGSFFYTLAETVINNNKGKFYVPRSRRR